MKNRLWALLLVALAGCAANPQQERPDPETLFQRGQEALDRRRWTEAIDLFERFTLEFPGHPRVQQARFNIGQAHYGKKEYVTAASEFVRFATDFPTSPLADDARARTCDSYEQLSPQPQLDQQYTRAAIDHCEALISLYPQSEFTADAARTVARLREKLAEKLYDAGEYYQRRRALDSAVIYFEDVIESYPQSTHAPRALLRLVEIFDTLGYEEEAEAARARLQSQYPQSPEASAVRTVPIATGS